MFWKLNKTRGVVLIAVNLDIIYSTPHPAPLPTFRSLLLRPLDGLLVRRRPLRSRLVGRFFLFLFCTVHLFWEKVKKKNDNCKHTVIILFHTEMKMLAWQQTVVFKSKNFS